MLNVNPYSNPDLNLKPSVSSEMPFKIVATSESFLTMMVLNTNLLKTGMSTQAADVLAQTRLFFLSQ